MRASRLLSILMLLQTRGRMSAQALAAEAGVSVATVYRDVDELSAAGVPIYAERGRSGGFRLQEGWQTRLTGLTVPEAQALFFAGLPGPAAELGLGDVMAAAQLKLLAALPTAWQADAQRLRSRFHLDPVGWYRTAPAPSAHIPAVAEAVWSERRLKIRYEGWTSAGERVIEPLGFVLKAGVWYVVARSGGEPRTFRLSNILELTVLDERFTRPADFDLARSWEASMRSFQERLYRETAVVRVSAQGLSALRRSNAAVSEALAQLQAEPDAQGWLRAVIPFETIDDVARDLLALGAQVEVLRPAALRERMTQATRALAELYGVVPAARDPASAQR